MPKNFLDCFATKLGRGWGSAGGEGGGVAPSAPWRLAGTLFSFPTGALGLPPTRVPPDVAGEAVPLCPGMLGRWESAPPPGQDPSNLPRVPAVPSPAPLNEKRGCSTRVRRDPTVNRVPVLATRRTVGAGYVPSILLFSSSSSWPETPASPLILPSPRRAAPGEQRSCPRPGCDLQPRESPEEGGEAGGGGGGGSGMGVGGGAGGVCVCEAVGADRYQQAPPRAKAAGLLGSAGGSSSRLPQPGTRLLPLATRVSVPVCTV